MKDFMIFSMCVFVIILATSAGYVKGLGHLRVSNPYTHVTTELMVPDTTVTIRNGTVDTTYTYTIEKIFTDKERRN